MKILACAILRADGNFVTADELSQYQHGTLRNAQVGVADAQAEVYAHNPNPTYGETSFFGYVDHLVPVYTNGDNGLQGLLLARRDASSAFFYAVLDRTTSEILEPQLQNGSGPDSGKQWVATFEGREPGQFHVIKDADTGETLGFVKAGADGKVVVRIDAVKNPLNIDEILGPIARRMEVFAIDRFVTPEGTFGELEAVNDGAVEYRLKIDGGSTYDFDSDGYLTRETDRQGNRTEYAYKKVVPTTGINTSYGNLRFANTVEARLTDVTLQGNRKIHLDYSGGFHTLRRRHRSVRSHDDDRGQPSESAKPGDVGDQSQALEVVIGQAITPKPDAGKPAPERTDTRDHCGRDQVLPPRSQPGNRFRHAAQRRRAKSAVKSVRIRRMPSARPRRRNDSNVLKGTQNRFGRTSSIASGCSSPRRRRRSPLPQMDRVTPCKTFGSGTAISRPVS
ncbi:MAG: hypothetical protein QM775_08750 [Pirellulales bacterium]